MLLRVILALVVLFIVFAVGVKIGELKSAFDYRFGGGYGGRMMMRTGYGGYGNYGGMMGGGQTWLPGSNGGAAVPPTATNGTATSTLR